MCKNIVILSPHFRSDICQHTILPCDVTFFYSKQLST